METQNEILALVGLFSIIGLSGIGLYLFYNFLYDVEFYKKLARVKANRNNRLGTEEEKEEPGFATKICTLVKRFIDYCRKKLFT